MISGLMTRKIREERSVNMDGKHFKPESETIVLTTEVKTDDYYKARIQQLESDIRNLSREVQALEDKEEKLSGVIAELTEENEKLRNEIIRRIVG